MKLHFHKCEIRTFLLPCLGDNKIKMHCLKSFVVNQVIVIEKKWHTITLYYTKNLKIFFSSTCKNEKDNYFNIRNNPYQLTRYDFHH